ncbi:MAG: carboxypeptidase regulatory-like domain-containing protein, partial [Candidatus Eremiobacteraeota bacterium]|nr:carboxypeptidase regulatory-like domain-containing protein [Candidatus Eremiobacteraeota bacterium]
MMRLGAALIAIGILLGSVGWGVGAALPMTNYTVDFGKTITIHVDGATSAYAIVTTIVEANAHDGVVELHAVGAGSTGVVVVTPEGQVLLTVTVPVPQVSISLGSVGGGGSSDFTGGAASETGTIEGGYNSSTKQVTSALDLRRRDGDSFRRLEILTATYVAPTSGKGTAIPLLSYEVGGKNRDVTFFDKNVSTSTLTISNTLLRGIHVQAGPWRFEFGASTLAQFGNYVIPTAAQWVAGVSRAVALSARSTLTANLYDIVNSAQGTFATDGGVIGSLQYAYRRKPSLSVSAELGVSRAVAFAAEAHYNDPKETLDATLLDKPAAFASLATDAQQGFFAGFDFTRAVGNRLNASANLQQSNYAIPGFQERSLTAQGSLTYALIKHLSVTGSSTYSSSSSTTSGAGGYQVRTLSLPVSLGYSTQHLNAGVQYSPTTDLAGSTGAGYGANAGVSYGAFSASAFYRHAVDIPSVASVFSTVPGLQASLEQAGITVTDPAQLAALLNDAALLQRLGFTGLTLDLAPARNDIGLTATLTSPKASRQQVIFSYLSSTAALTQGTFGYRIASLSFQRRLSGGNEVSASAGYLTTTQSGTLGATTQHTPTFGLVLRHRFASVPGFLFPSKHGTIAGHVFRDDAGTGNYASGAAGLAGVEVALDDDRTTRTDASGRYVFERVASGPHSIAARPDQATPFSFTTDSPASAQIGEVVNIGISFVAGKLFGYVTNDAGDGVEGATVLIAELAKSTNTESDGHFSFDGVPQGTYTLQLSADSLPVGYDVTTLTPVNVTVQPNAPASAKLTVRALRSLSGTVTAYDTRQAGFFPAANIAVAIPKLGLSTKTDASG